MILSLKKKLCAKIYLSDKMTSGNWMFVEETITIYNETKFDRYLENGAVSYTNALFDRRINLIWHKLLTLMLNVV